MKTLTKILLVLGACILCGAVEAGVPGKVCINNMRILEAATDQAAIEGNLRGGDIVPVNVLSEYIKGGVESLRCPSKGVYTYGTVDNEPKCNVHGEMSEAVQKHKEIETQELLGRAPETDTEVGLDKILQNMSREQRDFDPEILKNKGVDGMRKLAERLFPQISSGEGGILSDEESKQAIADLAAKNYETRENAEQVLKRNGAPFREELEKAARGSDPEVINRAKSILKDWDVRNKKFESTNYTQYIEAIKVYITEIDDLALLAELKATAKAAERAGAINNGQKQLIKVCLETVEK